MKLKVVLNETEEIDLNRIDGLSSLSQSTSDNSTPQYGILANTGSIDLIDTDGKLEKMIADGELPASSASADIYIDDKLVQKHITTDSTYDRNGNELQISLSNNVDLLSNMVFSGVNYDGSPSTAYDILLRVFSEYYGSDFTEDKFKELMSEKIVYGLNDELYGPVYSYLKSITIEYPYVESGKTYKEIVDEFCAMAQLQMYVDTDGYIKATSARPVVGEWDFVVADKETQMSEIKEDLFVKNKYNGVEITENKHSLVKEYETTVAVIEENIYESDMTEYEYFSNKDSDVKKDGIFGKYYINYLVSDGQYRFFSGAKRFEKKSKNNLEEITNLYDNFKIDDELNFTLTYKKGESNSSANISLWLQDEKGEDVVVGGVVSNYHEPIVFENIQSSGKISGSNFSFKYIKDKLIDTVWESSIPNSYPTSKEYIKLTDEGETFFVEYNVVCSKTQDIYYNFIPCSNIKDHWGGNGSISHNPIKTSGLHKEEIATKLEININGDKYVISFTEDTIKNNLDSGSVNIVTYPTSSFITDKTKYEGVKISDLIVNKLLKDYSNGVKTATLTTTLNNLSTLHGYNGKVRDNYLIEIADVVYPERDGDGSLYLNPEGVGMVDNKNLSIYKTTGFNLKYDGEILNELELMNVKYTPPVFSFKYDSATDGYSVTSNIEHSDLTQLIIPETYDDGVNGIKDVTVVGWEAFSGFENLKSIILPYSIKKISSMAFRNCRSLEQIILPVGLETISDEAFNNCSSLKEINIPDTVTTILSYAFVGCSSSMVINCSMTEKPEGFASYWNHYNYSGGVLQTNFIPALTFALVDGYYQVTGLADSTVKHIVIPEKYNGVYVVAIADNAFKDNNTIRTVETGNMLAHIGKNAFWHCRSLYKVTLGFGVESIGDLAFDGCEKLISVDNRSSLKLTTGSTSNGYIKYYANDSVSLRFIEDFVFIEQNSYPYNMTLISYDGNERNIVLPTKGTYEGENIAYNIYRYAFNNCNIETVSAGENVVNIGDYAFNNCVNLTSFAFTERGTTLNAAIFSGCSSLSKVYIPSTVTTIPATMFYLSPFNGCPSTTKIYCGARSKPSGWGSYWNYYNASNALSTSYGYTKAQYEAQ